MCVKKKYKELIVILFKCMKGFGIDGIFGWKVMTCNGPIVIVF